MTCTLPISYVYVGFKSSRMIVDAKLVSRPINMHITAYGDDMYLESRILRTISQNTVAVLLRQ